MGKAKKHQKSTPHTPSTAPGEGYEEVSGSSSKSDDDMRVLIKTFAELSKINEATWTLHTTTEVNDAFRTNLKNFIQKSLEYKKIKEKVELNLDKTVTHQKNQQTRLRTLKDELIIFRRLMICCLCAGNLSLAHKEIGYFEKLIEQYRQEFPGSVELSDEITTTERIVYCTKEMHFYTTKLCDYLEKTKDLYSQTASQYQRYQSESTQENNIFHAFYSFKLGKRINTYILLELVIDYLILTKAIETGNLEKIESSYEQIIAAKPFFNTIHPDDLVSKTYQLLDEVLKHTEVIIKGIKDMPHQPTLNDLKNITIPLCTYIESVNLSFAQTQADRETVVSNMSHQIDDALAQVSQSEYDGFYKRLVKSVTRDGFHIQSDGKAAYSHSLRQYWQARTIIKALEPKLDKIAHSDQIYNDLLLHYCIKAQCVLSHLLSKVDLHNDSPKTLCEIRNQALLILNDYSNYFPQLKNIMYEMMHALNTPHLMLSTWSQIVRTFQGIIETHHHVQIGIALIEFNLGGMKSALNSLITAEFEQDNFRKLREGSIIVLYSRQMTDQPQCALIAVLSKCIETSNYRLGNTKDLQRHLKDARNKFKLLQSDLPNPPLTFLRKFEDPTDKTSADSTKKTNQAVIILPKIRTQPSLLFLTQTGFISYATQLVQVLYSQRINISSIELALKDIKRIHEHLATLPLVDDFKTEFIGYLAQLVIDAEGFLKKAKELKEKPEISEIVLDPDLLAYFECQAQTPSRQDKVRKQSTRESTDDFDPVAFEAARRNATPAGINQEGIIASAMKGDTPSPNIDHSKASHQPPQHSGPSTAPFSSNKQRGRRKQTNDYPRLQFKVQPKASVDKVILEKGADEPLPMSQPSETPIASNNDHTRTYAEIVSCKNPIRTEVDETARIAFLESKVDELSRIVERISIQEKQQTAHPRFKANRGRQHKEPIPGLFSNHARDLSPFSLDVSQRYRAELPFTIAMILERVASGNRLTRDVLKALYAHIRGIAELPFDAYAAKVAYLFAPPHGRIILEVMYHHGLLGYLFPESLALQEAGMDVFEAYCLYHFFSNTLNGFCRPPQRPYHVPSFMIALFLVPLAFKHTPNEVSLSFAKSMDLVMRNENNIQLIIEITFLLEHHKQNLVYFKEQQEAYGVRP